MDYQQLAAEYAVHRQVHPGVLQQLLEVSGVAADSDVLDVGCGTGNYVAALSSLVGCRCTGIEPCEEMLEQARQTCPDARLIRGAGEALPFEPGAFDLVYSVDVMHHLEDLAGFFSEAWRVLRPGGKLCVVTDSEEIIRSREPLSTFFPGTVAADLARYPSQGELVVRMRDVGFAEIGDVVVELQRPLTDVGPYRGRAFSCLHLISPEEFEEGLKQLEEAVRAGTARVVSRSLLLWGLKPA